VAQTNVCINNLRQIDGAKEQWALEHKKQGADTPTEQELSPFLRTGRLLCPAGGTYSINAVNERPTCSIPKHRLPE
jgi:hypothetical protein